MFVFGRQGSLYYQHALLKRKSLKITIHVLCLNPRKWVVQWPLEDFNFYFFGKIGNIWNFCHPKISKADFVHNPACVSIFKVEWKSLEVESLEMGRCGTGSNPVHRKTIRLLRRMAGNCGFAPFSNWPFSDNARDVSATLLKCSALEATFVDHSFVQVEKKISLKIRSATVVFTMFTKTQPYSCRTNGGFQQ